MQQKQNKGRMMDRSRLLFYMKTGALVLLGNLLVAAAVAFFVLPNGLCVAGVTGIGLLLYRLLGIPVSVTVLVFNLLMLLLGLFFLGRRFFLSSLLSSLLYPVLLLLLTSVPVPAVDSFTAVLMTGLLLGAGIGLVIRVGASTGGMDIPELMLARYTRLSLSASVLLLDAAVLLTMAFDYSFNALLHGVMIVAVQAFSMEKTQFFGRQKVEIKVVSRDPLGVSDAVMRSVGRGTTLLHSRTGYKKEDGYAVLAVMSSRELPTAIAVVKKADPDAFVIVANVGEVRGRGFDAL